MTNAKAFGSALSKARKEQGFSSAHQFFKSVGGSRSLGLSFMSYWDMERGKKLPKSWRLKAILAALGVNRESPQARALVRAYFRALSGSDELLQTLEAPAAAGGDLTARELAEAAAQQALAQRSVNLTLEQWKLRSRDTATTICQSFLVNTAGWVTVGEISDATGFKAAPVRQALKALAAGGLIELSGDRARSPFVQNLVRPMPATPATAAIKAASGGIWAKWLADSRLVDSKQMTIRMTKAKLDLYRQHLEKFVNLSCIYGNSEEDRRESAVYCVSASVYQILPKK
jgi:ribosomal protein L12E/L44/L45/RPP1/RPP2